MPQQDPPSLWSYLFAALSSALSYVFGLSRASEPGAMSKRPAAAAVEESVASCGGDGDELVQIAFTPRRSPGAPVLTITLLGKKHTLRDAAEVLFEEYLEELLGESLDEHVWGFSPYQDEDEDEDEYDSEDDMYGMAITPGQPLLSGRLGIYGLFDGDEERPEKRYRLTHGAQLLFSYDVGSPTELRATVTMLPAPAELREQDYPKAEQPGAAADGANRQEAGAADAAFPLMAAAILSRRYSAAFVGACARSVWGAIEGGPADNGDQLFMPMRMDSLEDWFICAEAAWPTYLEEDSGKTGTSKGWTNMFVFPPQKGSAKDEEKAAKFMKQAERLKYLSSANVDLNKLRNPPWKAKEAEIYELCGPQCLPSRLTLTELEAARAKLRASGFDFAAAFPRLTAFYSKHKYAWFSYRRGRLTVSNKEMADASEERRPRAGALLNVQQSFTSLQALLEAVEAAV